MTSQMDRGDSYRVAYLGCAQLQHMATGLGVLQKPLRDLYIKARKPSNSGALQQRHLTMTSDGMRMSFKPKPSAPMQEEFYALPFILLWDAVRFVLVQSSDKKDKRARCAFEPLDNDHSRNKDNLFSPLDKKYKFLQQQQHGAIFTCVLRRTKGVKALDIHAFLCASDEEAVGIVHALNAVQSCYNNTQANETGVFGYSPYGKSTVRVPAGADLVTSHFAKTPPAVKRGNESNQRAVTSRTSPAHVRQQVANKQPPHVKQVFSPVQQRDSPHSNQLSRQSNAHSNQLGNQRRVFHLSQEDLSGPQLQIRPGFDDFNPDLPNWNKSSNRESEYEYTGTIRQQIGQGDLHSEPVRLRQKGVRDLESGQLSPHRSSANARHSVHDPLSPTNAPFNYLGNRANVAKHGSEVATLGQGYSISPGDGFHGSGAVPHTVSTSQSRQLFRDLQELQARCEQSDNAPPHRGGHFMRPPKSPGYLEQPPNMDKSDDKNEPIYQNSQFNFPQRRTDIDKAPESANGAQTQDNSTPAQQRQKPVARVPPHMKTGVRVLPENFSIPLRTDEKSGSADRSKSGLFSKSPSNTKEKSKADIMSDAPHYRLLKKSGTSSADRPKTGVTANSTTGSLPDGLAFGSPRRPRSQFGLHSNELSVAKSPETPEQNWQLGGKNKNAKYGGRLEAGLDNNLNDGRVDRKMGEKLLMSKKKDAEIASVMQNLRLDYRDAPTLTPGAPGGMNFERSLGYFP